METQPTLKKALESHDCWIALVITGFKGAPTIIPMGLRSEAFILSISQLNHELNIDIIPSLKNSYSNFGYEISDSQILKNPILLLVPLKDDSKISIMDALSKGDLTLALFTRKTFSARARYINWNRREGTAIGIICKQGQLMPVVNTLIGFQSLMIAPNETDFWDWFLSSIRENNLTELMRALYRNLQWERESQFSTNIAHKFAFNWIAIESMLPIKECDEGALVRRCSLVVGYPRKSDAKQVANKDQEIALRFANKNGKAWVKAIKEMYSYRCSIFHDGANDLEIDSINSQKLDWFYHLAKDLNYRISEMAVEAICREVKDLKFFWDEFVIDYLYSENNPWLPEVGKEGSDNINFDWENDTLPDYF